QCSLAERDGAGCPGVGEALVVGNDDYRTTGGCVVGEFVEHGGGCCAVQSEGWFIGQQDGGFAAQLGGEESGAHGEAAFFATRESEWVEFRQVFQAEVGG